MSIEAEQDADLESLGRELGEAIARTPEYREFEAAREAVEADDEAQAQIEEFEQIRQEFMAARNTGSASESDVQRVKEAQAELHSLPVMADFLTAREALVDRLEDVNEAISEPLGVDFGGEAGGCCHD
jgi:cell fate (sporulation/competence/biofilm development) regulator YlbF (YheA/YmcA/DUF963 family)